jgi:hypothetical protein
MCPTHLTHFLSCSSQYSFQHPILKHPQVFILPLSGHSEKKKTKLTVVSPPKHMQHSLHLKGIEVSDHLHASADLILWAMHPSVPKLVIQPD